MADVTKIEWTGATWNPITGCSHESPGCIHCYAQTLAGGRLQHHPSRAGLTKDTKTGPVWTGEVRFNEEWLQQPIRWTKPRDIFVVAHGDLFHEAVPDEWIDRVFAIMALAPLHRFQVLTKRTDRMRAYIQNWPQGAGRIHHVRSAVFGILKPDQSKGWSYLDPEFTRAEEAVNRGRWPLPNVWLGTSVERQQEADKRREPLAALAAAGWNTWVSYEPALGPVDWSGWEFIRWLVDGGESGPKARPSHPHWHYAARDFCLAHNIPYFFKQWGSWREFDHGSVDVEVDAGSEHAASILACAINPGWLTSDGRFYHRQNDLPDDVPCRLMERVGKKAAGHLLDGVEWRGMPV
jgi:protein gp37